jgi:methionyl-tRNA formyltransferase
MFTAMSSSEKTYIVAGSRPWNRAVFDAQLAHLPGNWHFAATSDELSTPLNFGDRPRYIFFLHWSMRVPDEWLDSHECVCFHMTDVPYGRGGSPLQNLIQRGHRDTMLTALRMVHEMDAGPVYAKRPLSLEGSAEEIYLRAGRLSAEIIADMVRDEPVPVAQSGEPVVFKRRRPEQSAIPADLPDLGALHDFIRMLDAEGYPQAFIEHGGFRLEFSRAALYDGRLVADVKVTRPPSNPPPSAPAP